MAKKQQDLSNLFAKTEPAEETGQPGQSWPADNSDLDSGRISAVGVGLTVGEIAALDDIGNRHDLARNALIRYAARRFILDWRSGKVQLTGITEDKPRPIRQPKKRLQMPK